MLKNAGAVESECDSLLNQLQGRFVLTLLMQEHAQQVQGVGVPRIDFENLSIDLFRAGEISGAMHFQRNVKRFRDGWHKTSALKNP